MELEPIKKTQTEGNLCIKYLETQNIEKSLTNRVKETEEKISGIEDTVEEMDTLDKEKV